MKSVKNLHKSRFWATSVFFRILQKFFRNRGGEAGEICNWQMKTGEVRKLLLPVRLKNNRTAGAKITPKNEEAWQGHSVSQPLTKPCCKTDPTNPECRVHSKWSEGWRLSRTQSAVSSLNTQDATPSPSLTSTCHRIYPYGSAKCTQRAHRHATGLHNKTNKPLCSSVKHSPGKINTWMQSTAKASQRAFKLPNQAVHECMFSFTGDRQLKGLNRP